VAVPVESDGLSVRIAQDHYKQGAGNFLDVVFAQMSLFQQQQSLAQAETEAQVNLVTIYIALGGGWQAAE
jgi:outer membrane protein TolC